MASNRKPHGGDRRHDIVQSGGGPGEPSLDFDDEEIYSGRNGTRDAGTTRARGGDSGRLGPPVEQLSDSNGPSAPANRKGRS
ncbi:hypothetical protein FHT32_003816 [Variovorax sp. SG517]|nr:hypothetical protein [Variovorax sp. SG517]